MFYAINRWHFKQNRCSYLRYGNELNTKRNIGEDFKTYCASLAASYQATLWLSVCIRVLVAKILRAYLCDPNYRIWRNKKNEFESLIFFGIAQSLAGQAWNMHRVTELAFKIFHSRWLQSKSIHQYLCGVFGLLPYSRVWATSLNTFNTYILKQYSLVASISAIIICLKRSQNLKQYLYIFFINYRSK